MKPYFDDGRIRIYHARWEDVWPALGLKHEDVALLWADPPYGVKERTNRKSAGRGKLAECNDFPEVAGDDRPFDPAPLLMFPRAVLWGANHYGSRLPDSADWWTWDKRNGDWADTSQADSELAWTNLGGRARIFRHLWTANYRASEHGVFIHPTQKPVALATWGFQRAKLKPGDLVFSPYMGSGPEARAALDMGLRFIGCEIVEAYCKAAVNRLRQRPLFADGV